MSLSTQLSRQLIQGKLKDAKFSSIICCLMLIFFGSLHSAVLFSIPKKISNLLINDSRVAEVASENMLILAGFMPLVCLQGGIFGIIRSIDRQRSFLIFQLICNYGVHFGSMAFFYFYLKLGLSAMWWARFSS